MLRSSSRLLFVITLFLIHTTKIPVVYGQQQDDDADQKPVEVRQPLDAETLAAVLKKQIRILKRSDPEKSLRSMRALRDLRAQASPAIPNLCAKLSDSDDAIRRAADEALEAIGEDSIAPLRKIMLSESVTKRAAAIGALAKLHGIKFEEFDQLVRDPDVRVRAAAAVGLAATGKPGVPLLIRLLSDRELAVAYEAASSLGTNREDPDIAIPALTACPSSVKQCSSDCDFLHLVAFVFCCQLASKKFGVKVRSSSIIPRKLQALWRSIARFLGCHSSTQFDQVRSSSNPITPPRRAENRRMGSSPFQGTTRAAKKLAQPMSPASNR